MCCIYFVFKGLRALEPLSRDGAKGFIYFQIGVTDQEKNHALRADYCFKLFTIRLMPSFINCTFQLLNRKVAKALRVIFFSRSEPRLNALHSSLRELNRAGVRSEKETQMLTHWVIAAQ